MKNQDAISVYLWTDFPDDDADSFNRWYDEEHMPDRVMRIPGFTRGRRYVAVSGGPRYLAHYEMKDREVLVNEAYVEMRRNPDPTSRQFIPKFQNTRRSSASARLEFGDGTGEFLAILGTIPGVARDEDMISRLRPVLETIATQPDIGNVRLMRTDTEAIERSSKLMSGHARSALREPERICEWVVTVEGSDSETLSGVSSELRAAIGEENLEACAVMKLRLDIAPAESQ